MRLIDGDALMDVINRNCYPVQHDMTSIEPGMTCVGILQAIQEQPTIEPGPRWIPCEESLPQSRTACFVTTECGGERNTCISVFDCGTGWSNLEYGERVISWINLPEPWGGERDGSD